MKVRFFSFAAVISLVTALAANAQKPRLFTSVSDLPNTKINVIYQDRKGFVWVGTEDGIARFDGTRFTSFHNNGEASGSSGSEIVLSMLEDSRGVTWVGTSQELQIFDQEHNSFQKFELKDEDEPWAKYYVYGLLEVPGRDGKSRIAVSVSQHGIYFIDTETHELDNDMSMVLNSMPGVEFTNRMFLDSDGRMWLASEFGGFKIFDMNRLEIVDVKWNTDSQELSRDVGMSRVHMNRKLKECISLSPSNLIKSIRLKQAAYLLANNKVNISEVAYRVGFSTHSYFSSSFHDYFGLTPKEFVARYSGSKDDESLKKLLEL